MKNQVIYERLVKSGISIDYASELAMVPDGSDMVIWGVYYENGWPKVSMFAGCEGMNWEQAYKRVLDLRDNLRAVSEVHDS